MEKKEDSKKRMEEGRKEYLQIGMTKKQVDEMKKRIEDAKREKNSRRGSHAVRNIAVAAAAAAAAFVALPNLSADVAYAMGGIPVVGGLVKVVTFRDYQYESERNNADVETPELVADVDGLADANGQEDANGKANANGQANADAGKQEQLKQTTEEINAEIQQITDKLVAEFEANVKEEGGYQDLSVSHEVVATTDDYFTLKLICYQAAGSGAEWDYFYTVDLNTGERLALEDLFVEGADYITPISENIKQQMRDRMAEDENVIYWVDSEDMPEGNFEEISKDASFYLNENGEIVICFNEGDVAPMYMGTDEFVIPNDVVADIRK